eukprot:TRINITY_DN4544_c0_g1_i1.p1 TRINITY_DN4544_c0_g1~~TRINITY_DN4544_c0_g1_i1.p1  ORF type:complete len:504 (+),score=89.13 TRINITY_DN4544_c0_g1_i1:36-1547(+)
MGCGGSTQAKNGAEGATGGGYSGATPAPTAPGPKLFDFKSGLLDCCATCPDNYKVVAEIPGARLVEMTLAPGEEDKPHDHPAHSMFFVQGGKLCITDYDETGKSKNNAHEVEIPSGAPPIFPPGPHQVKNVGDTTVKVIFVEPTLDFKGGADVEGFISPFDVAPECYKTLAESDAWITGMMTMEVGAGDPVHNHRDHLIYVLEGDNLTINVGGDEAAAMAVDIKPNAGIPAPMSAPPFAKHSLKNTGTVTAKLVFFEAKPSVKKVEKPAAAEPGPKLFDFKSGLLDCCATCPDNYKVVAEIPGARLVEMTLAPGEEDKPHDHPAHSMFFVQGGKLCITDYDETGKSKNNAHEVEIPSGAPPIFPPGPHQVKNVGDTTVKVIFVEPTLDFKGGADVEGFISPFDVAPECYKTLAESDAWITGMMTMEVGAGDPVHNHRDHLIYVLEGDNLTINVGGDEAAAMAVDIKPNAGIPAPMSAPPFAKHSLKNTGTVTAKLVFFEAKKS